MNSKMSQFSAKLTPVFMFQRWASSTFLRLWAITYFPKKVCRPLNSKLIRNINRGGGGGGLCVQAYSVFCQKKYFPSNKSVNKESSAIFMCLRQKKTMPIHRTLLSKIMRQLFFKKTPIPI
uniref:Uncharacterized protein n=1 Tax=Cacopsylla melanoneura TaxID=428564 RepID=A0A8D8RLJ3_9HEMI